MKKFIQHIGISFITLFVLSCNDNFLTENSGSSSESYWGESSPIVISPDWEAKDYSIKGWIHGQNNVNDKYTISHVPSWLKISSLSGQFTDGIAILNCKANTYNLFSEIGVYSTYLRLSVENQGMIVPIVYIVEGNPVIETQNRVIVDYNNLFDTKLPIKNIGNGVLMCSVSDHSEWLSTEEEIYNFYGSINFSALLPDCKGYISLFFNPNGMILEDYTGKIVLATNDKNKPKVEIEVQVNLGNASMDWRGANKINFGQTETWQSYQLYKDGDGILVWKVEGCPEWLSVSESYGILSSFTNPLSFTCNRELLSPGVNTATIYLKTNDKNNPSYAITVTAQK